MFYRRDFDLKDFVEGGAGLNQSSSNPMRPGQDIGSMNVEISNGLMTDVLLTGLVKLLEDVAGIEDATALVGSVAGQLGSELERKYSEALCVKGFTREQISAVLVDLENRAGGEFFIIEDSTERIILGNSRCPLGRAAIGHPALCTVTSNLLGRLTANAIGYAAVDLEQTIAKGDHGCRIVIDLAPTDLAPDTREYFRDDEICV